MISQGIKAEKIKTFYIESFMYSELLNTLDKWLKKNKEATIHDIIFPPLTVNCGVIIVYEE